MTVEVLKEQMTSFAISKAGDLIGNTPAGLLFMPVVKMWATNTVDKADGFLRMLTDKSGNIDALELIRQYEETLINAPEKVTIGMLEIGGGIIKFDVPFVDKVVTMDASDIQELKNLLTTTVKDYVNEI